MKRDSALIFGFSILFSMAIVGGLYYMSVLRPLQKPGSEESKLQSAIPKQAVGMSGDAPNSQSNRTNQIIKCVDPEIGEFWTNASDCETADLDNRISSAQSYNGSSSNSPVARKSIPQTAKRASINEPDIRQVAREVPDGLGVTCKFAVGKALELERPLSAADDPAKSIWREDYCKWIRDSYEEQCKLPSGIFFYESICPRVLNANKRTTPLTSRD